MKNPNCKKWTHKKTKVILTMGDFLGDDPNKSGVGAIDRPDGFEQIVDQRYVHEVSEKFSCSTLR